VEGEEPLVLQAFAAARAHHPALRLLLVPRHPERFDEAAALATAAGWTVARRSALSAPWSEGEVLVLDTLGELPRLYAQASVVFVGGSLVPMGGHNVMEAAAAARPVIVGPHMENFQEAAAELRRAGALLEVATAAALAIQVDRLLADAERSAEIGRRGCAVVEHNRGALQRTVDALAELMA
jgi:3-deoxy-D-manno-octulosonic-acid transferase